MPLFKFKNPQITKYGTLGGRIYNSSEFEPGAYESWKASGLVVPYIEDEQIIELLEQKAGNTEVGSIKTKVTNLEQAQQTQAAQLAETETQVNNRIDNIIVTPTQGITEQEILDARQGKVSLGGNLSEIKNSVNTVSLQTENIKSTLIRKATVTNLVNQNFSNFQAGGGTMTISGGIATSTGNGTQTNPRIFNNVSSWQNGKIYAFIVTFKVTNSICQYVDVDVYPSSLVGFADNKVRIKTPEINREYSVCVVSKKQDIPNVTGLLTVRVAHVYATSADSTGKVCQVSKINLFDITDLLTNYPKLSSQILNKSMSLEGGYVTGTKEIILVDYNENLAITEKNGELRSVNLDSYKDEYTYEPILQFLPRDYREIYSKYDGLVAKFPNKITRNVLGVNAQGYEIIEYSLVKPNIPNIIGIKRPKLGITSGVHGNEPYPVVGLIKFIESLCEGSKKVFEEILNSVDIRIVPCVNPTGWNLNTRNNGQNVNLNRNFTAYWNASEPNSGASPASELETQIIQNWLKNNKFDYFVDYHDFLGQNADLMSWLDADDPGMVKAYYRASNFLDTLWRKRYSLNNSAVLLQQQEYANLAQLHKQAKSEGAKVALIEIMGQPDYSGLDRTFSNNCAAELIGNYIINVYYYIKSANLM